MPENLLLRFEYLLHWTAVLLYVLATIFFAYAVFFNKEKKLDTATRCTAISLLPHSAAIALRWYVSGHGPYLNRFEGLSSSVWMAMLVYLLIAYRIPRLKPLGLIVLPASFLLLAVGILNTPEIANLPPSFHTIWLIIHILFNKLALGAMLLALGCSLFYLAKEHKGAVGFYQRLPDLEGLDAYTYKFCGFSFVFWSITVIAGAIWAHQSWGRYWAWDPIETWSLITWLAFGLYMHLRRFHGLRQRKAAYFMIICFLFVIATLFLIPFITKTVHTEYLLK